MPPSEPSSPPTGQSFRRAFEALVTTFNERNIRYAIIGGVALIQHTRVRATDDIDALMAVPQLALPGLFEALQQRGFTIDLPTNLRELRDDGLTSIRFQNVAVDLLRPMLPAHSHVLDRFIRANVQGHETNIGSAEALIVMKLMAMRPQDEADIQDLIAVYGPNLDLNFIRTELDTFTDASDPTRVKFEEWVARSANEKP